MVDRKETIVYVVSNFPCYSETFILSELVELRRRGYRLIIFSLKKPKEKIIQSRAVGFLGDIFYSPFLLSYKLWVAQVYFIFKSPAAYFGLVFEILRYCLKNPMVLLKNLAIFPKSVYFAHHISPKGINHIHAHFANYPVSAAMIVSRLLNIPFSFTCHAHDIFYDTTMLDLKIKNSKICFVISEYNRHYISGLYPDLPKERLKILHYGIDLEKFPSQKDKGPTEKLRILSVARLMPTKGFDDLIRSCRILKDKDMNFICKIVGEGPMGSKLKKLIISLDMQEEVKLVGPLDQEGIIMAHKETDIFILPSKRARHRDVQDGMPLVLIESMAMGTPAISTRISGIPELIEEGVSGFLVDPGDYKTIADKILLLSADVQLRKTIAENAHNRIISEFDIRKSIDILLREISCG